MEVSMETIKGSRAHDKATEPVEEMVSVRSVTPTHGNLFRSDSPGLQGTSADASNGATGFVVVLDAKKVDVQKRHSENEVLVKRWRSEAIKRVAHLPTTWAKKNAERFARLYEANVGKALPVHELAKSTCA